MAVYGPGHLYGTEFYGYDLPPAYRVDPFTAVSINYTSVLVSWTAPAGNISAYRLVKNRFGFPVDQDDGEILIDSISFPGLQFIDDDVVPGTYQYYGFFVMLNNGVFNSPIPIAPTWVRSGWTACLAIKNFESGLTVNELIPDFYKGIPELSPVLPPTFPTTTLDFFCQVLGWGIDYLKTQYDTYLNVNNPWTITIKDLYNLGAQLGININPDIHPYTLRKAIYFNAVVNEQRGTLPGIDQELEVLTGYAADLQLASNFMLENDQSGFTDPSFIPWSAHINYNVSEFVSFGNFFYQCINGTNIGNAPSGTNTSNTWWQPVQGTLSTAFLTNAITGKLNTWELLVPSLSNGRQATNGLFEAVGIQNPLNAAQFTTNGLSFGNTTGGTTTLLARSVCRATADVTTNGPSFPPNKDQVVGDGIPVPFVNNLLQWNGTTWNSTTRYGTNQIVTYSNAPFIALRASTNVTPPVTNRFTGTSNEWAWVSFEPRFRIGVSGYFQASTSGITVTPFVEWYDANGNFIVRETARNTTAGTTTLPTGLVYDSFTSAVNSNLNNRRTDDASVIWTQQALGVYKVSPFSHGCIYPPADGTRTEYTVNAGVSNCQVGITFITAPPTGDVQGLLLRWQDDNNYLRATMTELDLKSSGAFTTLGTYTQAANPGDRLVVQLNGSTITCLVNNVQVLQVTNSFNVSGTNHGIISEGAIVVTNPGSQSSPAGTQI